MGHISTLPGKEPDSDANPLTLFNTRWLGLWKTNAILGPISSYCYYCHHHHVIIRPLFSLFARFSQSTYHAQLSLINVMSQVRLFIHSFKKCLSKNDVTCVGPEKSEWASPHPITNIWAGWVKPLDRPLSRDMMSAINLLTASSS